MIFDTHVHLNDPNFKENYEELIKDAKPVIEEIIEALCNMVDYLGAMKNSLQSLLAISPEINNTGK